MSIFSKSYGKPGFVVLALIALLNGVALLLCCCDAPTLYFQLIQLDIDFPIQAFEVLQKVSIFVLICCPITISWQSWQKHLLLILGSLAIAIPPLTLHMASGKDLDNLPIQLGNLIGSMLGALSYTVITEAFMVTAAIALRLLFDAAIRLITKQ